MQRSSAEERFVVIGGGKMGEAMIAGWITSEKTPAVNLDAHAFTIVDPGQDRRAHLVDTYGVQCVASASEVTQADIVILAVKPQVMDDALAEISALSVFQSALFVSVAAGINTDHLVAGLPHEARVVRTMPNTPLLVGQGATAVCGSSTSSAADVAYVQALFNCLGMAREIDEDQMDGVCAVSGSGPAYVCAMIEAVTQAGVDQGLPRELAESLFLQTVYGTARLLRETGQSPEEVRQAVSSPGGTTLAALDAFDRSGLDEAYAQGVKAAARRSKELGA